MSHWGDTSSPEAAHVGHETPKRVQGEGYTKGRVRVLRYPSEVVKHTTPRRVYRRAEQGVSKVQHARTREGTDRDSVSAAQDGHNTPKNTKEKGTYIPKRRHKEGTRTGYTSERTG